MYLVFYTFKKMNTLVMVNVGEGGANDEPHKVKMFLNLTCCPNLYTDNVALFQLLTTTISTSAIMFQYYQ